MARSVRPNAQEDCTDVGPASVSPSAAWTTERLRLLSDPGRSSARASRVRSSYAPVPGAGDHRRRSGRRATRSCSSVSCSSPHSASLPRPCRTGRPGWRRRSIGGRGRHAGSSSGRGPLEPSLLPYLLAPALEAGLLGGVLHASSCVTGLSSAVHRARRAPASSRRGRPRLQLLVAQWVVLALCLGLLAAWVRRVARHQVAASSSSYASAYRLLSQLRVVSRQLSGGLDPVSLAAGPAAGRCAKASSSPARAVYVRSEGGRLVPMAFAGVDRADWTPALDDDSAWAEAWTSGRRPAPQRDLHGRRRRVTPPCCRCASASRTIGLVGIERTEAPFTGAS